MNICKIYRIIINVFQVTGVCSNCRAGTTGTKCGECAPHVTGVECDTCESGYYGLDQDGCKGNNLLKSSLLKVVWSGF